MPVAMADGYLAQALALAPSDPGRARAVLAESLRSGVEFGYASPGVLSFAVFASARLAEWPIGLRALVAALQQNLRSRGYPPFVIVYMLNMTARGLALPRPEVAATVQGAATALVRSLAERMDLVNASGNADDAL